MHWTNYLIRRDVVARVLALVVAFVAADSTAIACSFEPLPADQVFRAAGAVFVGTVVESNPDPREPERWALSRVIVEERYKGSIGAEVIVGHSRGTASCGLDLPVGTRSLFLTGPPIDGRVVAGLGGSAYRRNRGDETMTDVLRRFGAEIEASERVIRESPNDHLPKLARASLLEEWGDLDAAYAAYQDVAAAAPAEIEAFLGTARILLWRGRYVDAMTQLGRANAIEPSNSTLRFMLENARIQTADTEVPVERDLPGLRLVNHWSRNLNLSARDLTGAILAHVDMSHAEMSSARLAGARIQRSRLTYWHAAGIDLSAAQVQSSRLRFVRMPGARLDGVQFRDINGVGFDLHSAFARGIMFNSSQIETVNFAGADLRGAHFVNVLVADGNFSGARLAGATIQRSIIRLSAASNAEFDGAAIGETTLDGRAENISFANARLSAVAFNGADLTGARFMGAELWDVYFGSTNLTRADFTNARGEFFFVVYGPEFQSLIFTETVFRGVIFMPEMFVGTEVDDRPADLSEARMEGSILSCGRLVGISPGPDRRRQIAWIRALEPRRRGIILGEGCERVPELADVR